MFLEVGCRQRCCRLFSFVVSCPSLSQGPIHSLHISTVVGLLALLNPAVPPLPLPSSEVFLLEFSCSLQVLSQLSQLSISSSCCSVGLEFIPSFYQGADVLPHFLQLIFTIHQPRACYLLFSSATCFLHAFHHYVGQGFPQLTSVLQSSIYLRSSYFLSCFLFVSHCCFVIL